MLIFVCEVMNLPTAGSQQAGKCLMIALLKKITEPCSVLEGSLSFHGTKWARSRITEKKCHWWPFAPFQNKNGNVSILQSCLNSVWLGSCGREYINPVGWGKGMSSLPLNHLVTGRPAFCQSSYVIILAWYKIWNYSVLLLQGESGCACLHLRILIFR